MFTSNKLVICGHQRSGSNYLMALLAQNFYNRQWIQFVSTHGILTCPDPAKRYIYISRNSKDVLCSIYKMRKAFYISASSFDDFLKTKYCDMVSPIPLEGIKLRLFRYTVNHFVKARAQSFAHVQQNPLDYHKSHFAGFSSLAAVNEKILLVSYDQLLSCLDVSMKRIADFIDSDVTDFREVKERVGYFVAE